MCDLGALVFLPGRESQGQRNISSWEEDEIIFNEQRFVASLEIKIWDIYVASTAKWCTELSWISFEQA